MDNPNRLNTDADIIRLAEECIARRAKERPELTWLKKQHLLFMQNHNLSGKEDADRLIYSRIYGKVPEKKKRYPEITLLADRSSLSGQPFFMQHIWKGSGFR